VCVIEIISIIIYIFRVSGSSQNKNRRVAIKIRERNHDIQERGRRRRKDGRVQTRSTPNWKEREKEKGSCKSIEIIMATDVYKFFETGIAVSDGMAVVH